MKRMVGKIIEVYIPEQYRNGNLLDVMDRTNIGFKVKADDEILVIEEEQDDINCSLLKGDTVLITKQVISGKEFIDIEYLGEDYE